MQMKYVTNMSHLCALFSWQLIDKNHVDFVGGTHQMQEQMKLKDFVNTGQRLGLDTLACHKGLRVSPE